MSHTTRTRRRILIDYNDPPLIEPGTLFPAAFGWLCFAVGAIVVIVSILMN